MERGKEAIREHYRADDVVSGYVGRRFRSPTGAMLHARQVSVVRSLVRRSDVRDVLEIAPGPGRVTVDIASHVRGRLVLLDASVAMLHAARGRIGGRPRFVLGDAFGLPFVASFQLVYTYRLIRHLETDERRRVYEQIARVLQPGGFLVFDAVNEVVSAPLRARTPEEYPIYDALLRPEQIRREVAEAGFRCAPLQGVQRRHGLQQRLQNLIAPRSRPLGRMAVEIVERLAGGEPLEWIVTCRRA